MFDLDTHLLARSRAACARFGPSFIERIPWSVKFIDSMNVGIRSLHGMYAPSAAIMRHGFSATSRDNVELVSAKSWHLLRAIQ